MMTRFLPGALVLLALTGCQLPLRDDPGPDPAGERLRVIEAELEAVDAALAAARADLRAIDASQLIASDRINTRLDDLNGSVSGLPAALEQFCREQAYAAACEEAGIDSTVVIPDGKMVVGEQERVRVDPPGAMIVARMDTGATSSSLHAERLVRFERDGDDWVRFDMTIDGEAVTVERPVVRHARVIQQADPDGSRRPVVELRIALGNVEDTYEFTLADRSHLENEMILGRNFLTDLTLVDVSRQFIQPPQHAD